MENTGLALSKLLMVEKYKNYQLQKDYPKTYLFTNTFTVDGITYKTITDSELEFLDSDKIQVRLAAFYKYISQQEGVKDISEYVENEQSKTDYGLCPVPIEPKIEINGSQNLSIVFDGCTSSSQTIQINASHMWSIQSPPPWLTISPQSSSAGETVVSIQTGGAADVELLENIEFKLKDNNVSAYLSVHQNKCESVVKQYNYLTWQATLDESHIAITINGGFDFSIASDVWVDFVIYWLDKYNIMRSTTAKMAFKKGANYLDYPIGVSGFENTNNIIVKLNGFYPDEDEYFRYNSILTDIPL